MTTATVREAGRTVPNGGPGSNGAKYVLNPERVHDRIAISQSTILFPATGLPGGADWFDEFGAFATKRIDDSMGRIPARLFENTKPEHDRRPWDRRHTLPTGSSVASDDRARLLYYILGGATHQWIAFQGYAALPAGELKTEMASYLPTDPEAPAYGSYLNGQSVNEKWLDILGPEYDNADHEIVPADAVVQGAYEEDAEGVLDGTIDGVHFWNPDGGHAAGLVLSGTTYPSAFQEAQEETFPK